MENLKVVGSRLLKIEAERNPEFNGKLEIKTNIKIDSIEKIEDNKDAVKLSYTFGLDYSELGKINIKGILFLTGDSKSIQKLLDNQKDKKYEDSEFIAITNLIIQKASIKALELEEELGLPIHIKLPTLSVKK